MSEFKEAPKGYEKLCLLKESGLNGHNWLGPGYQQNHFLEAWCDLSFPQCTCCTWSLQNTDQDSSEQTKEAGKRRDVLT